MIHHPYLNGYSVLPALEKLGERPSLFWDADRDWYLREKQLAARRQQVFLEHDVTDEIYAAACEYICLQIPDLQPPFTFAHLAEQLQEDLAIHRASADRDWLAACHVSFPSGWLPEEKIGQSFREIHVPVPGFNLNASSQLVRTMIHAGPFLRYVWSPIHELRLNYHPAIAPGKPTGTYVKVERQVIVGFPQLQFALFIIRQQLITNPDLPALERAIASMTAAEKKYKGVL
jgi:hypothetical protein